MSFKLTILGSNSAVPAFDRFPTSQILEYNKQRFLIDCGEGAQFQLNKFKIKRSGLDNIFISHLHADHFLGLVGLISTMRLNSRTKDLHIYAPAYLKKIIDVQLNFDETRVWTFEIVFHALKFDTSYKIFENNYLEIFTIPLDHKIECNGFLFKEKPKKRNIIADKIKEYNISYPQIKDIKNGKDLILENGFIVENNELTTEPPTPKSYAYCSDTKYSESIIPIIKNVDLLYHESTFMDDLREIAENRYHTTSKQAAIIAKKAEVKKLIIGHFSSRYRNLTPLLEEAKTVFKNTELAVEACVFEI